MINQRFQSLIFEFCQIFDFKSTSKTKFDIILQYHNKNQRKSLRLSDNNETPGQINYFFENYSFRNHFLQLQSLSILGLKFQILFHYKLLEQAIKSFTTSFYIFEKNWFSRSEIYPLYML